MSTRAPYVSLDAYRGLTFEQTFSTVDANSTPITVDAARIVVVQSIDGAKVFDYTDADSEVTISAGQIVISIASSVFASTQRGTYYGEMHLTPPGASMIMGLKLLWNLWGQGERPTGIRTSGTVTKDLGDTTITLEIHT